MDGSQAHRDHLNERHQQLERDIANETRRPSPNPAVIQTLKKQKLKVKEEIEAMTAKIAKQ